MSVRKHLLLLVLAVWLPAAIGFGLLAASTYSREEALARDRLEQLAVSVNSLVEREIDQRAALATALAASSSVREGRLDDFYREAVLATRANNSWAILVDRQSLWVHSRLPAVRAPMARPPGLPFVTTGPTVVYADRGSVVQRPVLGVFVPQPDAATVQYNVGVVFEPARLQGVLDRHRFPEGSVAAVLDHDQRIMARSRDAAEYVGVVATDDLRMRAVAGQRGFFSLKTHEGTPTLAYVTAPNAYRWVTVVGLPVSALTHTAEILTMQAVGAAAALLLIGLVVALLASRRIARPVLALADAAAALSNEEVPPQLITGVSEADVVSSALHAAGERSREASRALERQVADAVQRAEQAQALLFESQKHEAIGRLTGGLSHDFNNLLQTIDTALYALERGAREGTERRLLGSAQRACGKAADLVRQMLSFGRAQPLQPQHVDLRDLLLQSQELTNKAVGERVALRAAVDPRLPLLYVDPAQLELALLNLVFNARDAITGSGHITLRARPARPDEARRLAPGPYVCLEVSDDGVGMTAQTAAKAFDPYFTTKPRGAGSGLGLPQVLAFARQSGGDAAIDSTPGQGTTVRLLLPASGAVAATPPVSAPRAAGERRLSILMVEDDPLVASVVAPLLESEGHRVTLVPTADEAAEALRRETGFEVLFADIMTPGRMTGLDLARWCTQHRPALAVLVATGYAAQQKDATARLLRKPYAVDELLEALQSAVRATEATTDTLAQGNR